ncbi:MAG: phenylacetate--CoA ligase family protein [Gammaproteobacteria bacterium]
MARVPTPLVASEQNQLLHSLLLQLEQSQAWDEERMVSGQLQQLRKLLGHALSYSDFYRERCKHLYPAVMGWDEFRQLPLLTRAELRKHKDRIDCAQLPQDHGGTIDIMTSGSTGSPVKLRGSGMTNLIWHVINMREQLWQQRDPARITSAIRWHPDAVAMPPLGSSHPDWGFPINQFYRTGPAYVLNSSADIEAQLTWLGKIRPHYLMTHPSNLKSVLQFATADDPAFSKLLQLRTVGERVDSSLREAAKELLGVPLVDFYSSQELGYIALQCPQHEHYHVQSESLIVEILDADGRPQPRGEPGRLVITSLRNYATPLIRYEIGDFGEWGECCDYAPGLPVLKKVTGRVRNMLRLPNGQQRWPNFGFKYMMDVAAIQQFQVVQTALDAIELRLVVGAPLSQEQEARLARILADHLGYSFAISISYHDALPRGAGGKFEDFLSLLSPP